MLSDLMPQFRFNPAHYPIVLALSFTALVFVARTASATDALPPDAPSPDSTVALDGSAQFKTIQAAVDAAPAHRRQPFTIHIASGHYKEVVTVPIDKPFLRFVGDDADKTILTYDNFADMPGPEGQPKLGTRNSASTHLKADDFAADRITFENTHGLGSQALAISVTGDRCAFHHCRFFGWQDTVLIDAGRQYFADCYINGHVDFIFGAATAYFKNCNIHCLGKGYITAASTPQDHPYGYVFDHCQISGAGPSLTYLGRPWRPYASVTFLNCEMSDVVRPEGWNNWRNADNEKTARYAEYDSRGPGANASPEAAEPRAPWSRQLTADEAAAITPAVVLAGPDAWNPAP
jgi:pectinesterase